MGVGNVRFSILIPLFVVLTCRISQLPDGSLRIGPASINDSGVYTVLADNRLGQVARNQLTLKVYPSRLPVEASAERGSA